MPWNTAMYAISLLNRWIPFNSLNAYPDENSKTRKIFLRLFSGASSAVDSCTECYSVTNVKCQVYVNVSTEMDHQKAQLNSLIEFYREILFDSNLAKFTIRFHTLLAILMKINGRHPVSDAIQTRVRHAAPECHLTANGVSLLSLLKFSLVLRYGGICFNAPIE